MTDHHHQPPSPPQTTTTYGGGTIPKEAILQTLNTIIQLHFEKTLEKKKSVDFQKKQLWKLFQHFLIFLALIFAAQTLSPRLRCRHCWAPITMLTCAHLILYVSVAQTLRCINVLKYQRRCHKLTLGVATEKLRLFKIHMREFIDGNGGNVNNGEHGIIMFNGDDYEVQYQEPPESYFGKFKRNWALYFGFLVFVYCLMVSSSVSILCF